MNTNTLKPERLQKIDADWRAANYLSVGQVYLYDNPELIVVGDGPPGDNLAFEQIPRSGNRRRADA